MSQERRPPKVLAMIVCDQVVRDEHTKKVSIIGSFNRILASRFPAEHRNCAIYVALTDGQGIYEGELRFSFAESDEPLLVAKGQMKLDHPLQVLEMNFPVVVLPLPRPGKYAIEFFADGERLTGRYFVAEEAQKEASDAPD